jgi:hypothetical protein
MIVSIDNPEVVPDLVDILRQGIDCAVDQLSTEQLSVAIFGSYRIDAMRLELESRLQQWRAAHPGIQLEILDDGDGHLMPLRNRLRPPSSNPRQISTFIVGDS